MQCLDVGASTGGFTDCLLQHGAARVWAVDVGHGQLAWRIRQDPRVTVVEGVNARNMTTDQFSVRFDIVTIDVSFISLAKIFPAVSKLMTEGADCIALVKPQFEVGKGEVGRGGIVTDPLKHRRVLAEVADSARESGLQAIDLIESPILGAEGNREFLMHLKPANGRRPRRSAIAPGRRDRQLLSSVTESAAKCSQPWKPAIHPRLVPPVIIPEARDVTRLLPPDNENVKGECGCRRIPD